MVPARGIPAPPGTCSSFLSTWLPNLVSQIRWGSVLFEVQVLMILNNITKAERAIELFIVGFMTAGYDICWLV